MGHKTGSWNRSGFISKDTAGEGDLSDPLDIPAASEEAVAEAAGDPLDHDKDGKKGGSKKGKDSTRAKGAAKAEQADETPAEPVVDGQLTQDEQQPDPETQSDEVVEEVSENRAE